MKSLKFISLRGVSILEQLHFEEQILRTTKENCFIFNIGNKTTNVVLGYSGKPNELINIEKAKRDNIEVYRRFTGGGTVVVDKNTVFTSFVMNTDDVASKPFPRDIMNWSERFFQPVFNNLLPTPKSGEIEGVNTEFKLREHDYVFGDKKFGGNAQSITKDRWVHHTSFLWDFDPNNMEYLQVPKKRPEYRKDRSHLDFITKLSSHLSSVEDFEEAIRSELSKTYKITDEIRPFTGAYEEYRKELTEKQGDFVPRSIVQTLE